MLASFFTLDYLGKVCFNFFSQVNYIAFFLRDVNVQQTKRIGSNTTLITCFQLIGTPKKMMTLFCVFYV